MKKFLPSGPQAVQGIVITVLALIVINKVPQIKRFVGGQ